MDRCDGHVHGKIMGMWWSDDGHLHGQMMDG